MPRNKRVFPFFLDGGIQTVTGTDSTAWNGTSSFVEFTGTDAKTITVGSTDEYGRPIPHGTMVVVKRTATQTGDTTLTVDPTSEFSTSDETITLTKAGDHVLLLWKAPAGSNNLGEWVELTFYNEDTNPIFQSANIAGNFRMEYDTADPVTAADGSTSVDATDLGPIDHPVFLVSSDDALKGIHLDDEPFVHTTFTLINTSGTAMQIYPDGGTRTTINGGASYELAANAVVTVYYTADAVYIG